jgi:hypothetical protein
MPPRFAYWTILIDGQPTAFRARDQQDLLPTLHQLKRTNKDVLMRWFARGRLWESQQQERDAGRQRKTAKTPVEARRGRDWRPGGQHTDPRARFGKKRAAPRRERERTRTPRPPSGAGPSSGARRNTAPRRFGNRPPSGKGRKR